MILNAILDTTSLIVVGIFLLVTLIVGLYSGKNVRYFKEYAMGGRFSNISLGITFLATNIGGFHSIGMVDLIYNSGIIVVLGFSSILIRNILLGTFLSKNIIKFKGCITIGDIMGKLYGKNIHILSSILVCLYGFFIGAMQLTLIGKIFHFFFNFNMTYSIIISGVILGLYSSFGGMKSIIITDVFQFLIFIIAIPLLAMLALKKLGGLKNLFESIPKTNFSIIYHEKFNYYIFYFIMMGFIPESLVNPTFFHRLLMSKNSKELRNKLYFSGVFRFLFLIIIMIISFSSICIFKNTSISKNILFHFINYTVSSSITKGFMIAGLISILMSTADSFFHTCGISISNDIFKNLTKHTEKNFNILKISKIAIIAISIVSIFVAINSYHIIKISILSMEFTAPIVLAPLIFGLFGVKVSKSCFIYGSISGILVLLVLKNILSSSVQPLSIPISIVINGLIFILVHLIQNKGIAIINRDYDQNKPQRIWKPTWQGFLETLFSYIPTPHKIFEFSRKSVSRCGANNMLFGIFVCINFIVPYFMWDHKNEDLYNLMIYLRFFGGLLGGLLIVKTEWKDFLKPYFPLFWHFTLLYCLPFISTVMFLLTNGSIIWLLNIGTSIFFLIILTENIVFLTLTPTGIVLGILFYILRVGPVDLSSFGFEVNYQLIYQVVFSSTIGLLFSFRKKIFNSIKGNEGTNLGLAMCHELRNTGLYIYPAAQISLMYLKKYRNNFKEINGEKSYILKEQDFEYIKEQNQEIERLGRLQKNIVGTFEKLLKEYRDSINDPQNFSMKHIVNQAIDQYIFKPGQKEKLDINLNKDFIAKIPKQVFIFVVDNIIRNSYKHGNPSKIKIWLEENELHIKDNGKGISEREMDLIFKMYFTNGDSSSSGIGLAFAKQIIEGFGGEIWVESQTGNSSYTEFIIKFPKVSEELSEEEIKENMELEIKKNIAKTMKEEGVEKSIIEKSIGISTDDMEGNE